MKLKRIFTDEHRRKISEAHKGKKRGPRPDWVKKKISDSEKGVKKNCVKFNSGRFKKGHKVKHTPETIKKIVEARKGWKMPRKIVEQIAEKLRGRKHTEEAKKKIGLATIERYENGPKSEKRRSKKNRDWSTEVIKRDGNKCTKCGKKEKLDAHHVIPWKVAKELRYVLDNGLTLCRSCHRKEDAKILRIRKYIMKTLCKHGFRVSSVDQKAFEHYVLVSMKSWSTSALKGMINKAIKLIMREWFEKYKETQTGNITADYSVIIPAITAMEGFKMNKIQVPKPLVIKRTEKQSIEIWNNGFDIEDYEEMALEAVYEDADGMLYWFMENKIYQRRKAFCKEYESKLINDKKSFPANEDEFIDFCCKQKDYKNRKQSELK